jgi:hypothetical protein
VLYRLVPRFPNFRGAQEFSDQFYWHPQHPATQIFLFCRVFQ